MTTLDNLDVKVAVEEEHIVQEVMLVVRLSQGV